MITAVGFLESELDMRSKVGTKLWPVYTSVRMLEGVRRIATYCHFRDGRGHGFGSSGYSVSSMSITK